MEDLKGNRAKLEKVLIETFSNSFPNWIIIDFPSHDIDFFLDKFDKEKLDQLTNPGVYAIHCLATERTYVTFSVNVLGDIESDVSTLITDMPEAQEELISDFKMYGPESFVFIIFTCFRDWRTFHSNNLINELASEKEHIKNLWPFKLYIVE